jgi:hypothetical protein
VDEGQAGFKCTLFSYIPTTNIQAWLAVGHKELPIALGIGTHGTWPLQEFLWPVPWAQPGTPTGIDPGFAIPPSSEGTRFVATFTAPPNLEHLLLANLQVPAAPPHSRNPSSRTPSRTSLHLSLSTSPRRVAAGPKSPQTQAPTTPTPSLPSPERIWPTPSQPTPASLGHHQVSTARRPSTPIPQN